ncbi:MAG TPA: metal-dependent hydrolase [Nitrosospira sp.]|nr:metal-dependent hydrolase [Nitrosospira sp.]
MDTLTHALSGALAVRAIAPAMPRPDELTSRDRMIYGSVAAAFPDSDILLRLLGPLVYIDLHRGVTHSIILLPLWALLLAWLLSRFSRDRYSWRAIYGTAALGIGIHIAGDVITAYGTMIFAPFSHYRLAFPFTFIIDPYFTGIIALGLAAALFKRGKRYPAVISLLILASYVGFQAFLHSRAVEIGKVHAEAHAIGGEPAMVYAIPQPLSPFHWKIIISRGEDYEVASIDLWDTADEAGKQIRLNPGIMGTWSRIAAGYEPASMVRWHHYSRFGAAQAQSALAREAWGQEIFLRFREFSQFPFLNYIETMDGEVCVRFADLRFTVPSLSPSLGFGVCRDTATGLWRLEQG